VILKYLLDTNICIFVIRQKPLNIVRKFQQHLQSDLGISGVTLAELRYGADHSSDPAKNHSALDTFLALLEIADFDAPSADLYGNVRADLERRGCPIGPLDTMIAAHALRLGVPLVTNNAGEFRRVSGLVVEGWAAP